MARIELAGHAIADHPLPVGWHPQIAAGSIPRRDGVWGGILMGQAALQLSHLRRLQAALEKIATDLDEIEGRSHTRLRYIAQDLNEDGPARNIESCVSNFEIAVRGRLVN